MNFKLLLFILTISLSTQLSKANEDGAFLSRPFTNLAHPIEDDLFQKSLTYKSDILSVIDKMSPVKSQGSRGTCSIFSATAMIEGLLAIYGVTLETDLSEEWLEYLNIASTRSTTDGSFTSRNFRLIKNFGLPYESTLPYESENWEKTNSTLENYRCSGLINRERTMCELGHFNPNFYNISDNQIVSLPGGQDFLRVKNEARNNKGLFPSLRLFNTLYSTTQIKSHLDVGLPIVLDINFFYGAWNHRKASELGIGRDMNHWQQGIVGYPEPNSLDYQKSLENRAGHSVLIVGYDNEKEITTNVRMNDGSVKTFTYKGVYYFKNSWGSESFGASLNVEGEYHSGYGMITQRYAHEHGSFYKLEMY